VEECGVVLCAVSDSDFNKAARTFADAAEDLRDDAILPVLGADLMFVAVEAEVPFAQGFFVPKTFAGFEAVNSAER